MAQFHVLVSIPDGYLPALEKAAQARGFDDLAQMFAVLSISELAAIEARLSDPMVGAFAMGWDAAASDEDVLRAGWQPD